MSGARTTKLIGLCKNQLLSFGFYSYFFMLVILNETIRLYATPSESNSQFLDSQVKQTIPIPHIYSIKDSLRVAQNHFLAILLSFWTRFSRKRFRFQNKRIGLIWSRIESPKKSVARMYDLFPYEVNECSLVDRSGKWN